MGLKCSILGHAFDDRTTDRDREESGNEVVIVERTVETCRRCGETRVVSENKEVTAIETPESDERRSGPATSGPSDSGRASKSDTDTGDRSPRTVETGSTIDSSGSEFEPPRSAAEDDGIILDDDDDDDDDEGRAPGEWPDDSEPDIGTNEDAEIVSGDDEIVGDDTSEEAAESVDDGLDLGPDDAGGPGTTVPEGTYRCPECGFTTDTEGASLRAGDYCPECHTGSLEQADS
ncbi:DUF7093 family protein [Halococcoides cellulosivorans]|uniref:Uncharacterized protein n=1 Tax=Halococcoides cellulosivorans TaxID=1679096 RepID=A0A2R4X0C2_9EURY|nr:hypothetical protein [Halococcoides cellulosivorans]AWB27211.1 hypothetical protein HARCEL1_05600 [Halococcoides cellulosivorans]